MILGKLPQDIVKPVIVASQAHENQTINSLMGQLQKEIAAKSYVEKRLNKAIINQVPIKATRPNDRHNSSRVQPGNPNCIFCRKGNHPAMQCRSVTDQGTRRNILKEQNRCWKCGSKSHSSFGCTQPDCSQCGQKHHISICTKNNANTTRNIQPWNNVQRPSNTAQSVPNYRDRNQRIIQNDPSNQNRMTTSNMQLKNENKKSQITALTSTSTQLVLMTAEGDVWNYNKREYEKILFLFDSGAQKTVIQEQLAERLGLPKQSSEICTMSGIGGHIENFKTHIVNLKVSSAFGEDVQMQIQTKPVITNGFPSVNLSNDDVAFLKENRIRPANSRLRGERQNPHVLVGLDHYHDLITGQNAIKTPTGLHVAETIFGPTIYGKGTTIKESLTSPTTFSLTTVHEKSEKELLQKIFELEGLGITPDECREDDKALEYLEQYSKKISFKHGYVTAPFPLKENISELEDNYTVAIRRLESLQKTLQLNPEQAKWYCDILQKYEEEGMIETFTQPAENVVGTYFMPHSGVWRQNKKVPLRIVFDGSSKKRGKLSLNDVIHKGESFVNKIHDILIRARTKKITMMCDIQAAFSQIRLVDNHKDLCRFVWVRNIKYPPTKDNLILYRFRRLPFGVTASPSILNMALTAYLNAKGTKLAKEIQQSLYVDNILIGAESVTEALEKYVQSKQLFSEIGMNLREYISNNHEV
ncbi:hypothetical protein Y032_1341g3835 [Ancylostoma ceylanicum]|uniref:Peptidase A2 domain-containing protein n=3 Tax=Ancylostoma ceylanicum TaxID=53326 RepID=A0A016W768_9BILA|nr:hypothetical protein Y032_1341g3835 [Ancylostoma ceylanicum]